MMILPNRLIALSASLVIFSFTGCAAAYNAVAKPPTAEQGESARFMNCAAKNVEITDHKARPAGGVQWIARCGNPAGPAYRCELATSATGVTCALVTAAK
jgi:hypothetical protein